jgi:hypothetical protein
MSAKLGIVGLIGLGCVAAAAGGGYWALRSNATDLRPAAQSEPTPAAATPAAAEQPAAAPDTANIPATPARQAVVPARRQPAAPSETRKPAVVPPVAAQPSPTVADAQPPVTTTPTTTTAPAPPAPTPPVAPTPPPAPAPRYDEVTVAADSVLGIRLDSTISTETARVEDRVNARLSRDVLVDGRVAIPSGARLEGTVTAVERGGKFKERPRLGIAFNALVLADGTRMAIQTETIFRDGDSPAGQANTKVGGSAVVGAILGAMIGGKKGAILGGTAGAAGGAAAVAAGDRAEAVLTSGTQLTARLSAPITVLIERNQ